MIRPESFARWCARRSFVLTRAQRIATSVCFDGVEPRDLSPEDREIARLQFGAVDVIPPEARSVVAWNKGARIGGTRMAAEREYQLACTVPLALAPGESAFALIIGPDLRLARQAFAFALASAREDAAAGRIVLVRETTDAITLRRLHDGALVTVECLPATAAGSAVRGRTLVGALLTEGSFIGGDEDAAINDVDIFRALVARVVPGGQLVIESTPWIKLGLLWELYDANHGRPTTCIAACLPTLLMRDDPHTAALVARERLRDPKNAAVEFDACFLDGGESAPLTAEIIDACFAPRGTLTPIGEEIGAIDGSKLRAGSDEFAWAFANYSIVYTDPDDLFLWDPPPIDGRTGKIKLGAGKPLKHGRRHCDADGSPLLNPNYRPSSEPILSVSGFDGLHGSYSLMSAAAVVATIVRAGAQRGVARYVGDQHESYSSASLFAQWGAQLTECNWNATSKGRALAHLRRLAMSGCLALEPDAILRQQLLDLREVARPSGGYLVTGRGGHVGDRAAVVLTICMGDLEGLIGGSNHREHRGSSDVDGFGNHY